MIPPQAQGDLEPDRARRSARARATHLEVRVFPDNASVLRLVTAVFVDIDATGLASTQRYIDWTTPDARSGQQRISRHQLAQSKRGLVTDTIGLPVTLDIHRADIQTRDAAVPLLTSMRTVGPWLRPVFGDGGYAADTSVDAPVG